MKTGHSTRQQLINELVADNRGGVSAFPLYGFVAGWWALSFFGVLAITFFVAPLRENWLHQLFVSLRYSSEAFLGLSTVLLFCFAAFKAAVPGAANRWLWLAASISLLSWIALQLYAIYNPIFSPSLDGARDHCIEEIFTYSLPIAALGFYLMHRGYVINWGLAGFGIGLAAGAIPSLVMQFACMYMPSHAFEFHLVPVLIIGAASAVVGLLLQWSKLLRPQK